MTSPVFVDGDYSGICSKCKVKRTFYGVVRVSETGRVFAEGPCPVCGTTITKVLVA
jgi:hypothetical protein